MNDRRRLETVSALDVTYHVLNGCGNCQHVFRRHEYDEGVRLYCAHNAPPRPPCGSVYMGEYPANTLDETDEQAMARHQAWDDWADPRAVDSAGWCKHFEKEPA